MRSLEGLIRGAAVLIEFGGSLVIAFACLCGLAVLATGRGTHAAIVRGRLIVADGVVSALGYKTAATLLKTIELQTWTAIGMFAAVLTLRTLIKRVLVWEETRLRGVPGWGPPRRVTPLVKTAETGRHS